MTYRAVKHCPGCGWCYDHMDIWEPLAYDCCPRCGLLGDSYDKWPTVSARRVWTPVWFKPWTWTRREWRAKG